MFVIHHIEFGPEVSYCPSKNYMWSPSSKTGCSPRDLLHILLYNQLSEYKSPLAQASEVLVDSLRGVQSVQRLNDLVQKVSDI